MPVYNINRFSYNENMPSSFFSRDQLQLWYTFYGLSIYGISKRTGCDPKTVHYWLKKFNITTRPRKKVFTDKKTLTKLYSSKLSLKDIGEVLGCSSAAVLKKFRQFNIPTRTPWQNNIVHKRSDFSNNLQEKAYLLGFRIGDLNIKQKSPNSFIIVKSNTTHVEQKNLLKNLFSKYGPVWISKSNGHTNIFHFTSSLNNSFSFLIPKHTQIPGWILKSKKLFLSFLAGYTDAEGSIGIYNKRAAIRIGSYDKDILKQIYTSLNRLKIINTLNLERIAGKYGKQILNGDFYRVNIRHRYSVRSLLVQLLPYLKHENRKRQGLMALKNVEDRIKFNHNNKNV